MAQRQAQGRDVPFPELRIDRLVSGLPVSLLSFGQRIDCSDNAVFDDEVIGVRQREVAQKLRAGDVLPKEGVEELPADWMEVLGKTSPDWVGYSQDNRRLLIIVNIRVTAADRSRGQ